MSSGAAGRYPLEQETIARGRMNANTILEIVFILLDFGC
jgi:hypothetical protein